MFIFASEREEIARLKERIEDERVKLGAQSSMVLPSVRKAAAAGSLAWASRKFMPLLRPLAYGLAQRSLAGRGKTRIIKVIGLAGAAFAAWKMFGGDSDDEEEDI